MPAKRKATTDTSSQDYNKLKLAELKKECKNRGLDESGKKADLVNRLQDDDNNKNGSDSKKPKTVKEAFEELKNETGAKKKKAAVDKLYYGPSPSEVFQDFDCMLNQTNIGGNNNKYYVIQLLKNYSNYYVWTRWGRVGEDGQNALLGPFTDTASAESAFGKKFKDKTKNNWADRANFVAHAGKYTLIEVEQEDEDQVVVQTSTKAVPKNVKDCTLDKITQSLVGFIFNQDMFKEAMESFKIDTKKMPLGKLSKAQIARGYDVLEEIQDAINTNKSNSVLSQLSSKFYTVIPHSFGRQVPPVLRSQETVQEKMDMLIVLGDIVVAQDLQKEKENKEKAAAVVDHPLDANYKTLKAKLTPVNSKDKAYKMIETYLKKTGGHYYYSSKMVDITGIWEIDREGEGERFAAHDDLKNRRLLWHGTNVAVVAAILKGGLRIMPHSGGRVGQGIYFASENGKSIGYIRTAQNVGIMFLAEVALGKEHSITRDNSSLKAAPKGYHSIIARGQTEPDPKDEITIKIDGKDVIVPQGKPIDQSKYSDSYFSQSEYLVYKESQVRLRYLIRLKV